jgi:hypothetical protein
MSPDSFSERHNFRPTDPEITIREDAPREIREAILQIATEELSLKPSIARGVLCRILRKTPDSSNWSEYPNIFMECEQLIGRCPWYKVYDFVESFHERLVQSYGADRATKWATLINDYFVEAGIGWRLVDGLLESRGPEAFQGTIDNAGSALEAAGLPTASQEMHEAIRDLSRRPAPDLTGAVQHAMAALECAARAATGEPRATLGDILRRYPDLFPRPLPDAISKIWGYASETARHVREGGTPSRAEVELIVGISASTCHYLAARLIEEQ